MTISKFIDGANEVGLLRAIDDELEANGADLPASVQPANADEVELLELARILYRRDKPEALRLTMMLAEGIGTQGEILRAAVMLSRLPVIH